MNDLGEEEVCNPIENITAPHLDSEGNPILDESGKDTFNDGDFLPNTGPLAEDACPFQCQKGYVKDELGQGLYHSSCGNVCRCQW